MTSRPAPTNYPVGTDSISNPQDIATGDFDNDMHLDLADAVAVGDLNGNRNLDVVIGNDISTTENFC